MRIAKWGNSLAVRLPAAVIEALDLKAGDDIDIVFEQPGKVTVLRTPTREELIARLDTLRVRLPTDYKFDRDEANAR